MQWFRLNSVCCHKLLACRSSCLICFIQILFEGENSADGILCGIWLKLFCVGTLVNQFVSKFYMMLDTTNLFSLIPVWMTLMVTEGHRKASHSVEKLLEATQMFMMADYVREVIVKKSCTVNADQLHLLFLFKEDCMKNTVRTDGFQRLVQCQEDVKCLMCPIQVDLVSMTPVRRSLLMPWQRWPTRWGRI